MFKDYREAKDDRGRRQIFGHIIRHDCLIENIIEEKIEIKIDWAGPRRSCLHHTREKGNVGSHQYLKLGLLTSTAPTRG